MTPQSWIAHPGRNPAHRFGEGRKRWAAKVPDFRTGKEVEVTFLGPMNPNRWLPHQGAKQTAKYARLTSRTD